MVGLLTNSAVLLSSASEPPDASQTTAQYESRMLKKPRITEISAPGVSVPFACDYGQYEHLLTMLARLVPYENVSMENIIDRGDTMFSPGTTVILVSAATTLTQATVERLLEVRTRGIAIQLVLTGDSFSGTMVETYDVPVHYLGGREKWHELIHAFVEEKSQASGARSFQLQLD
jgi:hypothetical protein